MLYILGIKIVVAYKLTRSKNAKTPARWIKFWSYKYM